MNTITILPDSSQASVPQFRAVAGQVQSEGRTMGEALDALTAQLGPPQGTTLVIVHRCTPDEFFTAEQQHRLQELMIRWRAARDSQQPLSPEEQAELDVLVQAELRAAKERAAALLRGIGS